MHYASIFIRKLFTSVTNISLTKITIKTSFLESLELLNIFIKNNNTFNDFQIDNCPMGQVFDSHVRTSTLDRKTADGATNTQRHLEATISEFIINRHSFFTNGVKYKE